MAQTWRRQRRSYLKLYHVRAWVDISELENKFTIKELQNKSN